MIKYFLYARKSTDEADRQVRSIESQLLELRELAKKENLPIVKEFIESQTAKEPGRPIFNDMMARIESGEATGILAWHPDRLARNSVDGGRIIYLADTGKIQSLKFQIFWFEPTPQGKFMLNIAFGQSKYYVDNLSENVKRGLRNKLQRGEWPGTAPVGYLNDKINHKIVLDSQKFPLVKKIFELYALNKYSFAQLVPICEKMGFVGNKNLKIRKDNVERLLKNPFYCGNFLYKGELYEGVHPPIVSKKLYDRVQEVLNFRSRATRKQTKTFVFRGFMRCGECGAMVTADTHKGFHYYHCTKRKTKCSQAYVREESLRDQIVLSLSKIWLNEKTIKKILQDWEKRKETETSDYSELIQSLRSELRTVEEKLNRLLDAYVSGLTSPEEYQSMKEKLLNQKLDIKQKLEGLEKGKSGWFEPAKEFILDCNSVEKFAKEKNDEKFVEILQKAGSNSVLEDKNLRFEWEKPYNLIARNPSEKVVKKSFSLPSLSPTSYSFLFRKKTVFQNWRARGDSNA